MGRRARSIKVWFVLQLVGLDGLRCKIRQDVKAAAVFEDYVNADDRFEIVIPRTLGVVCFRLTKYKDDIKV